jgi:glycerophosphoryl diester phosphodiesterase
MFVRDTCKWIETFSKATGEYYSDDIHIDYQLTGARRSVKEKLPERRSEDSACNSPRLPHYSLVIKIIAHRGASWDYPENSLEAMIGACRQQADIVETDVRLTADKIPVLCHDKNLRRLVGEYCSISDITAERFKGMKILGSGTPLLLEELLTMNESPGKIILDIKEFGIERIVNELICKHGWQERIIVSSFYSIIIKRFSKLNPDLETALILDRIATIPIALRLNPINHLLLRTLGVNRLHICYRRSNVAGAAKLVELGHKIAFWTVDEPDEIRRAVAAGPYGIMTNKTGIAREALKELGELD